MRRHRINRIVIWRNNRGFSLLTNGGAVGFFMSADTGSYYLTVRKLKHHLPHITKYLEETQPTTLKELENLLVGRYAYGRSVDISNHDGTFRKCLV